MKRRFTNGVLLVLGLLALGSTWWSVSPASERRYERLLARETAQPGAVTSEEWISSEMDGASMFVGLVFGGGIGLVILTCLAGAWTVSISGIKHLGISLGMTWVLVAALVHAWMWLWG